VVGACERGAERLDGAPICFTVRRELREVVDEGGVDHAIRQGGAAAQAFQVFEIASMHLGPRGDKRLGGRIRASKTEHLMARADELLNNGGTDKTGSAGDEDTHDDFSITSFDHQDRIRNSVMIEIGV